jgi:hypothetical protein
LLAMAKALFM